MLKSEDDAIADNSARVDISYTKVVQYCAWPPTNFATKNRLGSCGLCVSKCTLTKRGCGAEQMKEVLSLPDNIPF